MCGLLSFVARYGGLESAACCFRRGQVWCEMAKGDLLAFSGGQPFFTPAEFRSYLKGKVTDIRACSAVTGA